MASTAKLALGTVIEWMFLLLLWTAFVSQIRKDELLVGLAAAAIGAIADAVVKREDFFKFQPKLGWVLNGFLLPWYTAQGCLLTLKAFFLYLFGHRPETNFKVSGYDATGDDSESAAKRALAVAYLTIPPNSIIVGIDRERGQVLTHQIIPSRPNLLEKKLGVQS